VPLVGPVVVYAVAVAPFTIIAAAGDPVSLVSVNVAVPADAPGASVNVTVVALVTVSAEAFPVKS
jgi:hypothetical protein